MQDVVLIYWRRKTLACTGRKLFAGLKSSAQEQLKASTSKKGFRTEYGKTGLKQPKELKQS